MKRPTNVLALSGGVGGAKLALGLAHCLEPDELTVVCNTGDDFVHLGMHICPDYGVYTLLIGVTRTRLGQADESWSFLGALDRLKARHGSGLRSGPTHIVRTGLAGRCFTISGGCRALPQNEGSAKCRTYD